MWIMMRLASSLLVILAFADSTWAQSDVSRATCNVCEPISAACISVNDPEVNLDYITASLTGSSITEALVTFHLQVAAFGNYTIRLHTPGCMVDDTCSTRGAVNVTSLFMNPASVTASPTTVVLSQQNNFDKFDVIYMGFVQADTADFTSTVNMTPIGDGAINGRLTMVAQAVEALFNGDNTNPSLENTTIATSSNVATTVSTSSTTSPTASQAAQSHHLDKGSQIGLGVGLSLGLLLLTACIVISLRACRKRAEKAKSPPEVDGTNIPEMPTHANMSEMPSHTNMPELPTHANMSEMPAPPAYSDPVELKVTF